MLSSGKALLVFASAAALSACASAPTGDTNDLGFGSVDRQTTLTVENRYIEDMDIYLWNGAMRMHLGRASSFTTSRFTIPADVLRSGRIALQAKPIGPGRGFISDGMLVQVGQLVQFRLERNLALSGAAVWVR